MTSWVEMGLQDGQTARAVMNYYQVLEVAPDATPEDIKRAYRQLVRRHHPDVATEETGDRFHQIQAAYEILSDPGERRKYDLSVGWGRSPRTAIPYRPAQAKTGSGEQSSSRAAAKTSASKSPASTSSTSKSSATSPASPKPTQPTARSSQASDRARSAWASTTNRSKFDNTEFSNSGRSPNTQRQPHDRQAAAHAPAADRQPPSAKSARSHPEGDPHSGDSRSTPDKPGQDSRVRASNIPDTRARSDRRNGYVDDRSHTSHRDRPSPQGTTSSNSTTVGDPNRNGSPSYAQQMRTASDSAYNNGSSSTSNSSTTPNGKTPGTSRVDASKAGASASATRQASSTPSSNYKPYSPPPRPEPEIPNFNRGVKSLKEALRSNRYSLATEIADQLVAHYSNRPPVMRLFVKAYHLRGNEMLYYKRYELAEIYLYEALKTAHSHYPELVKTIQADLERTDTNRRELGMI